MMPIYISTNNVGRLGVTSCFWQPLLIVQPVSKPLNYLSSNILFYFKIIFIIENSLPVSTQTRVSSINNSWAKYRFILLSQWGLFLMSVIKFTIVQAPIFSLEMSWYIWSARLTCLKNKTIMMLYYLLLIWNHLIFHFSEFLNQSDPKSYLGKRGPF